MARRYAVDSVMAGESGPSSFGFVTEHEDKAIVEYRKILAETCNAAYTAGRITSSESGDAVGNAQSVMIAQLLGLSQGMRISQTVAGIHHFIEFIGETEPVKAEVEVVEDPLVKAVRECDIDTAKAIMAERDKLPRADVDIDWQSLAVREAKVDLIIEMIEYARQNYRRLDLSDFARGERNGFVNSILMTGGVPYAVVGEMRPSREWQTAHETVRLLVMDDQLDAEQTANWLIDLPKGEAAPKTQPDFAEQVRPELFPAGGETRTDNPWFTNEAKASVALDGETFAVDGPQD